GDRTQVALSDHLRLETIFDAIGVPDHTDHGPRHRKNSAVIVLCKDLPGWAMIGEDNACEGTADQYPTSARGPALLFPRKRLPGVDPVDSGQPGCPERGGCGTIGAVEPRQFRHYAARDGLAQHAAKIDRPE